MVGLAEAGRRLLESRASDPVFTVANRLLHVNALRKPFIYGLDRWLQAQDKQVDQDRTGWRMIARQRRMVYRAVLHTLDRVMDQGVLSPQVARVIVELWGRALCSWTANTPADVRFRQMYGNSPPAFLVISPSHACNLGCPGCYATSGYGNLDGSAPMLAWPVLDRVMTEAKELWGVPLFTFSGGEPLTYRSEGKDILDVVEKHSDCLFLMFTNGTLITNETARRMAALGNLTPALSVEGLRERTDERRGAGVFDRVLAAMAHLREAGVPFGISATVTRANCGSILSDEVIDFFFDGQGAFYAFLFPYMPTGSEPNLQWMPTPDQRIAFWRRSWEVVERRRVFLLDFWNHGPLVEGCISAGRDRGYMHIDWNGKVMPCVFMPYSAANINDIYAQGGTLNDVWTAPFFQAIRQWQRDYGYGRSNLSRENNWMQACPFRDHYGTFHEWVESFGAEPEDEAARLAFVDDAFCERMVAYGAEHARTCQQVWETEYLSQNRQDA
jgi:MoaA/NifB/PqqE/SkfB family radical SAM enzyme